MYRCCIITSKQKHLFTKTVMSLSKIYLPNCGGLNILSVHTRDRNVFSFPIRVTTLSAMYFYLEKKGKVKNLTSSDDHETIQRMLSVCQLLSSWCALFQMIIWGVLLFRSSIISPQAVRMKRRYNWHAWTSPIPITFWVSLVQSRGQQKFRHNLL